MDGTHRPGVNHALPPAGPRREATNLTDLLAFFA